MARLEIVKGKDGEMRVGGLRLVACRREIAEIDGGISLYVFGDLPEDAREMLRIDLFRERPHYHAPAENQAETKIELSGGSDVRDWGVDAITQRADELLAQGGFQDVAAQIDREALGSAGSAIRSLFDGLAEPTEVSYFEVPQSVLDSLAAG